MPKLKVVSNLLIIYVIIMLLIDVIAYPDAQNAKNNLNKLDAVIIDLNMNIDGGAISFWERVHRTYRDKVLILKINSYGGYISAADKIVSDIFEENISCYTWIPPGGYGVSAAAMIALACKGIFMGSGAVIGDAIPVPRDQKTVEYVASRFRALAEKMFGYNKDLISIAESMVRDGKTLSADEAISIGFAMRAESPSDLENILDIRVIEVAGPGFWDKLMSILSLPIITEMILVIGSILIIIEILTTGFQGYAIAGALLILLALYGISIISPDLFALTIMLIGIILIAIELYTPGFGVFGLSGIALLSIGIGYQLYLTPLNLLTETVYVVFIGLIALSFIIGFITYKAMQTTRKRRKSLEHQLMSSIGVAKTDIHETTPGVVYILGEDWTAYSVKGIIPAGSRIKVVHVDGLKLYVEKHE